MRRLQGCLVLSTAMLALVGCGQRAASPFPTWIGVHWVVSSPVGHSMSLEIQGSAWSVDTTEGGDGVVVVDLSAVTTVRVIRVPDCRVMLSFQVEPGSSHLIAFDRTEAASVQDLAGSAIPFGPGLVPRNPVQCGG